ncbi:hypothetical protein [Mycoplasma tauri]|uniref:hypothetical protein n=1 Tax=Mycoplasma tauri TaxID=547987 RepID=UPI001CC12C90|nr:hypothetical protein [Mycoplasma tauri]MBZ4218406.1 hypothetical protein [Mycoplasma tauri]
MTKKSKLSVALLLTGLPTAALAIALPFIHSNNNLSRNDNNIQLNALNKLKDSVDASTEFLKKHPDIKYDSRFEIEQAIKYAEQVGSIRSSSLDARSIVRNMLEARHRINVLLSTVLLREDLTNENRDNAINEARSHLMSHDIVAEFDDDVKHFVNNQIDKNTFIEKVVALVNKQRDVTSNVEQNINIFRLKILNKIDDLNISFKSIALNKVVDFIESRLFLKSSKDVVLEYENFFAKEENILYEQEVQNNAKVVKEVYASIDQAINELEQMDIDQENKSKLYSELIGLRNFVQSIKGNLSFKVINPDSKNISAKKLIENYISSFYDKTSQYFKSKGEVADNLQKRINASEQKLNTVEPQFKEELANIINQTKSKIKESEDSAKIYDIYSDFTRRTEFIELATTLLKENLQRIQSSNLDEETKKKVTEELNKLSYSDTLQYFEKSNEIMSEVESQEMIRNFISNRLDNLKSEYEFSKANAAQTGLLPEHIQKIDQNINKINELKQNKTPVDKLVHSFEDLINDERLINKYELNHIISLLKIEFSKETIKLSEQLVSIWKELQPYLVNLTNDFSTATREQLNEQIRVNSDDNVNAIELLASAKLANVANSISLENDNLNKLIEEEFKDNSVSPERKVIADKVKELDAKAKLILRDKKLSNEEKMHKLEEIQNTYKELNSNLHDLSELAKVKNKANDILENYKDNENAKIYFADDMKRIKDLKEQIEYALNNPTDTSVNLKELQAQITKELAELVENVDAADGAGIANKIEKQINDTFAGLRKSGDSRTPLEARLIRSLENLKNEADANKKITDDVEKAIKNKATQNKMDILRQAIPSLSKFETDLDLAKSDFDKAKSVADELKNELENIPEAIRTQVSSVIEKLEIQNKAIEDEIAKLTKESESFFDSEKHNKAYVDDLNSKIDSLRKEMALNWRKAQLEKESLIFNQSAITEKDFAEKINQNPYDLLKNDFDLINRAKNDLDEESKNLEQELATLKNQKLEIDEKLQKIWNDRINLVDKAELEENMKQIEALENESNALDNQIQRKLEHHETKIRNQVATFGKLQDLAAKLNEAAKALKDIDETKYPELSANLKNVIMSSRMNTTDDSGVINQKLRNLETAIAKIDSSKTAKDKLNELIALKANQYRKDGSNNPRAIFAEIDKNIENVINEQSLIISDPNSTLTQINSARAQINSAISRNTLAKELKNKEFEDAKKDFEEKVNELLETEKANNTKNWQSDKNNYAQGTEVQKLKAQYDNLITQDSAMPEQIKELKNNLALAFNKDKFNTKEQNVQSKIDELKKILADNPNINVSSHDGKTPVDKINDLLSKIKEDVDSKNKHSDASLVINQIEKLGSLEDLLEQQEKVIKKLASEKTKPDVKNVLTDILNNSASFDGVLSAQNPNNLSIIKKTHEVLEQYNNAQGFYEVVESAENKIKDVKTQIDDKLSAGDIDPKAKDEINKLLSGYDEQLKKIEPDVQDPNTSKKQASLLENKANDVEARIDSIVEYAREIKKADEISKRTDESSAIKDVLTSLRKELADEVTKAQSSYQDFKSYETTKDKIRNIRVRINESEKVATEFKQLDDELATLSYKEGLHGPDKPAEKLNNFKAFVAKLKEFANTDKVKKDLSQIQLLSSVIGATKSLISIHKNILNKYTSGLGEFSFQGEKYGYDWDEKNIHESLLSTVPEVPSGEFNPVDLTASLKKLQNDAIDKESKAEILYRFRKEPFDEAKTNFDAEIAKISSETNQTIYEELKKDQLIFYKEILTKIKNVNEFDKQSEIEKENQKLTKAHFLIDKYIELAKAIQELKDKKQEASSLSQTNSTDQLTEAISKTDEIVEKVEKTSALTSEVNIYFGNLNEFILGDLLKEVMIHKAKLDLLMKHAEAEKELKESVLKDDSRKILEAILSRFVSEIDKLDNSEKDRIDSLIEQYLEDGQLSFKKVLASSIQLQETIEEAKKFEPNQDKQVSADYYQTETEKMRELYDELIKKINEGNNLLTNQSLSTDPDLGTKRAKLIDDINNQSYGVISKIKSQKKREVNSIISELNSIDSYISSNYAGAHNPKINDFDNLSIKTVMKDKELNALIDIENATISINQAKAKIKEQKQAIYNFNKNRLVTINNLFSNYVKLLSGEQFNVESLRKLTSTKSTNLLKYIGIESEINAYKQAIMDVENYIRINQFDENSYVQDSKNMNVHYRNIDKNYRELKEKSKIAFEIVKKSIVAFNDQVKENSLRMSDENLTLFNYIDAIYKINNHANVSMQTSAWKNKLTDLNAKTVDLPSNMENIIYLDYIDGNYMHANDNEVDTKAKNEFKNYHGVISKLLLGLESINKLIRGENNSDDEETLKGIYTKFIANRTMSNFLNVVASANFRSDDPSQNIPFKTLISAYKPLYDSLNSSNKNSADAVLSDATSSVEAKLDVLKAIYEPSVLLSNWFNKRENQQLIFDYLIANEEKEMKNIVPNHKTLYEDFVKKINELHPVNNEIDITQNSDLLELFKRFAFLKNDNSMPFNLDNVKVYITRKSDNDQFAPEFIQADTSIKKTKLNFKVKYVKATNDNFYSDVNSFELEFNNIWVTFNTLTTFNVELKHMYKSGENNLENYRKSQTVFVANEAGWNNKTFTTNFLNAFSEAADFKKEKKITIFREDITFEDDNWDKSLNSSLNKPENNFYEWSNKELFKESNKNENNMIDFSTSSKNFKYKIKLNDQGFNINGKKYRLANFGNKKFMYWDQSDSDMKEKPINNSAGLAMWIPYFIYIPLVSEDGNDYTVLHISYQEHFTVPWDGDKYQYTIQFTNPDHHKWYLVNKTKLDSKIMQQVNSEAAQFGDLGLTNKQLNEVKANLLAQKMAIIYTDKTYLGKFDQGNNLTKKTFSSGSLKNNSFWPKVDKFNIFVRIREENEEVK